MRSEASRQLEAYPFSNFLSLFAMEYVETANHLYTIFNQLLSVFSRKKEKKFSLHRICHLYVLTMSNVDHVPGSLFPSNLEIRDFARKDISLWCMAFSSIK